MSLPLPTLPREGLANGRHESYTFSHMRPWQERLWELFSEELFPLPSSPELFNQYRDEDPAFDLPGAAGIRRGNLKNYLMSFYKRPRILLVGEAAGPWGARFSGVPFTSERQLQAGALPFAGRKTSNHEPPYSENSGAIVWGALMHYFPEFFLWNAVPVHPHEKGRPLSIRTPRNSEIKAFCPFLKEALSIISAGRVAAIGRKAEYALELIGVPCLYVRHPAQSGAARFREGIRWLFGD